MGFLYAFSIERNNAKKITDLEINFLGDSNLFITQDSVNKLLIQNNQSVTNVPKEILDLNSIENILRSNAMIKNAEVYLTVEGVIRADIIQCKPVARASLDTSFYIDDDGKFMPLSDNYTAHVPIISGSVDRENLKNIFSIAKKIYDDEFLRTHVVEIHQDHNQMTSLKFRVFDFEILLGDLNDLDKKINNLKAFYQKGKKDEILNTYSKVNLQFNNQVVCTKKTNHGK